MSIKIIEPRHYVEKIISFRSYSWVKDPNAGFSFPLNNEGNISFSSAEQEANYNLCETNVEHGLMTTDVITMDYSYWQPAKAMCRCGEIIWLDGDTCCEHCERWYNSVGQEIHPPFAWVGQNEYGEYYEEEY